MRRQNRDIYSLQYLPLGNMLFVIASPVILSLVVQAVYSLVDSIYVSRINEAAISAVSLAFVVQNLEIAIYSGIGAGINAVISKALGGGEKREARNATLNGVLIQVFFAFVFLLFGIFGTQWFFSVSTTDSLVVEYGIRYLKPFLYASLITGLQITYERFLNSVGQTKYVLSAQIAGAVINIVLDPILIFGVGSLQGLGINGAAYATILSKSLSLLVLLICNHARNQVLFRGASREVDFAQIRLMCAIGIPTSMTGVMTSVGNYCINRIVLNISTTAFAAYGLYIKLQSVLVMPSQGISVALITVFAFFYGKRSREKIDETAMWGVLLFFCWGIICAVLLIVFPNQLLSLFQTSDELKTIAIRVCRIIGLTYAPSLAMHSFTAFFQSTNRSYLSLAFIVSRQFLARIPLAFLLARTGDANLVWWSYPLSEIVSDIVIVFVFVKARQKVINEFICEESAVSQAI